MRLSLPIALFCVLLPVVAAIDEPVRIENGQISGTAGTSPEIRVFKGIPFATPPVGDLRWHAPKPAAKWDGVRAADKFSPVCIQTPYAAGSVYAFPAQPLSEDCLYLNVWTGAKSAKERRPVMVWVYGGALTRGLGSLDLYNGEELAKKGVVLVTFNYRLGVFGFFAHPELTKESDRNASGDYGLLDQVAALEWVHKNIEAFGGDPKRVTIFGESAGSWSVNYLMASPLTRGLFQRVIGESGAVFQTMRTLAEAEQAGVKFAQSQGASSIRDLRAKPAADLLKVGGAGAPTNVDGWFLPQDVYTTFAQGKQNDVPLLLGSNADEWKSLGPWPASGTAQTFIDQTQRRFGSAADSFLKVYPAGSDEQAKESYYASNRDMTFGWQQRTWARMQTKTGKSKVFLYYFSRVQPGPESSRYGAYHASEIVYAFHNLKVENRPWEDTDRKVSDAMSSYWVNFATTGDPNGKGLPKWPAYQEKSDMAMGLGDKIEAIPTPHKAQLDFLDTYFASLRAKGN
jgi:para-nitrobenzyl esterase